MSTGFFSCLLKAPIQAREMEGEGRYLGKGRAAESRRSWEDQPGSGSWGLRRPALRRGFRFLLLKSRELGGFLSL